jgi:uncharacterized membrane protein
MRVVVCSDIEAPRQNVWDYIVDPDRYPEFMEAVTRWEIAGTMRNGLGARFSMRMRIGSAELGGLIEIVEFDPPCDLAWTSITGVDHRGRWRLRRRNEGSTNLELRVAYHARGGIVAHLADRIASPIVKGHLRRSLKELKVRVESRQVS